MILQERLRAGARLANSPRTICRITLQVEDEGVRVCGIRGDQCSERFVRWVAIRENTANPLLDVVTRIGREFGSNPDLRRIDGG